MSKICVMVTLSEEKANSLRRLADIEDMVLGDFIAKKLDEIVELPEVKENKSNKSTEILDRFTNM